MAPKKLLDAGRRGSRADDAAGNCCIQGDQIPFKLLHFDGAGIAAFRTKIFHSLVQDALLVEAKFVKRSVEQEVGHARLYS